MFGMHNVRRCYYGTLAVFFFRYSAPTIVVICLIMIDIMDLLSRLLVSMG